MSTSSATAVKLGTPNNEFGDRFLPPSILRSLLDALDSRGFLSKIHDACACAESTSWMRSFPHSPVSNVYNGLQSAVIKILHPVEY